MLCFHVAAAPWGSIMKCAVCWISISRFMLNCFLFFPPKNLGINFKFLTANSSYIYIVSSLSLAVLEPIMEGLLELR